MRRLNSVFGAAPELRTLTARAGKILELQKIWEAVAPPPLHRQSHVGPLDQGRITVYTASGAVASKLKMQSVRLLEHLQNRGVKVTSIRFEVQVVAAVRARPSSVRPPSSEARRKLREWALALPESGLRAAMLKLVQKSS